jgi:hypothetical protein
MTDPRFPDGTPANGCSACRLDFASVSAFDRHRTGSQDYDFSIDHLDGRRCMDEGEMQEAGMELDHRGRWALLKTPAQVAFYRSQSPSNASEAA